MWPNPQETADLVTFTEKILNGKNFNFLFSKSQAYEWLEILLTTMSELQDLIKKIWIFIDDYCIVLNTVKKFSLVLWKLAVLKVLLLCEMVFDFLRLQRKSPLHKKTDSKTNVFLSNKSMKFSDYQFLEAPLRGCYLVFYVFSIICFQFEIKNVSFEQRCFIK